MIMSKPLPILYSYTGGMPPETLEVLWIGADGVAEYVTGNPWPLQAPFDEVGYYRHPLSAQEQGALWKNINEIGKADSGSIDTTRSTDAGLEYFRADGDERIIERAWNPNHVPADYELLAKRIRQCITNTRKSPVSTLSIRWLEEDPATEVFQLELHNRGSEPFLFYASQSNAELPLEVRIKFVSANEMHAQTNPNPLSLIHLEPAKVEIPSDWQMTLEGQVALPGGGTLQLEIKRSDAKIPATSPSAGALECLFYVNFLRPTPEGETMLEQGWLMPARLHLRERNVS